MTRSKLVFLIFVGLFGVVNFYLMASGKISADWNGFGIIFAAGLTLALYSFLYQDNPLFKSAEHIFVGVSAAYSTAQIWYLVLLTDVVTPVFNLDKNLDRGYDWILIFPTILGIFMLMRFNQKLEWLSRISFAFVVGLGAGFSIPRSISSFILAQIEPSLRPLTLSIEGFNLLLILIGVITVLIYFLFSIEHSGLIGKASKVGIWFMMISFGASFGYTIMARLSLLIGRVEFLLEDWMNLKLPLY